MAKRRRRCKRCGACESFALAPPRKAGNQAGMNPSPRYSLGAIILHWLMAILIIANVVIALSVEGLPKPEAMYWMGIHKANGITVLLLAVVRIFWRVTHPAPPFPATMKPWEITLARITHTAFYFLIVAIPLTGWLFVSKASGGKPIDMYGLFNFPGFPFAPDRDVAEQVAGIHEVLGLGTLGLLALHVAGAAKHMFTDGFVRMIPGRAAATPGPN
jgi:cytochrome b561